MCPILFFNILVSKSLLVLWASQNGKRDFLDGMETKEGVYINNLE